MGVEPCAPAGGLVGASPSSDARVLTPAPDPSPQGGGACRPTLVTLSAETLGYKGRAVLSGVTLAVREGERVALLGRSGSGKSTLLGALYDRLADRAALIPQAAALVPQLSCFHNVYMGRLDRHSALRNLRELAWPATATLAEVEAVLERVDLTPALRQKAGSLSGGQAQRTSVARALYNGRPVVLGDEPVSALDRRHGAAVLEAIHAAHPTSILALHDVALALESADRIVVLKNGGIALDAPADALTEREVVALYQV